MRIGIITSYDAANCGAYLQAFASMKFLKSQGHKVFMISWQGEKTREAAFFNECKSIPTLLKELMVNPRIYRLKRIYSELICRLFLHKNYRTMTKALKEFRVISPKEIENYELDAAIIGSDIVWDITRQIFQNPLFYGGNLPPDIPCYAYAPSMGDSDIADFDLFPEQKRSIKKINIIGVRDEKTAGIIEKISGERPQIVCDPTMLINANEYNISGKSPIKGKYLLVYSYGVKEKYRKYIKKYAEERGLKTVAAFLYQDWCDINISCSPLEFSALIKGAECVFTTTFHGSIFTFLNHKPCAVLANNQKIRDLLSRTGMEEVEIYDSTEYEVFQNILDNRPDYTNFERAVDIRRTESRKLYLEALK